MNQKCKYMMVSLGGLYSITATGIGHKSNH